MANPDGGPPKTFTFDAAYGSDAKQEQIYASSAYPIVESVLKGFNGTIFAVSTILFLSLLVVVLTAFFYLELSLEQLAVGALGPCTCDTPHHTSNSTPCYYTSSLPPTTVRANGGGEVPHHGGLGDPP